mmetsp:Transcript_10223/g.22688  ORF Transcript_10223/g.22688 Transcript_10223/m.22688 type:complete len:254 (-) Transcript_10223:1232-1993(-)
MSALSEQWLQEVAEALKLPALSPQLVRMLLPVVEVQAKKIAQQAHKFQRRSKAGTMTVEDVNAALQMNSIEPVYGLTRAEQSITSEAASASSSKGKGAKLINLGTRPLCSCTALSTALSRGPLFSPNHLPPASCTSSRSPPPYPHGLYLSLPLCRPPSPSLCPQPSTLSTPPPLPPCLTLPPSTLPTPCPHSGVRQGQLRVRALPPTARGLPPLAGRQGKPAAHRREPLPLRGCGGRCRYRRGGGRGGTAVSA